MKKPISIVLLFFVLIHLGSCNNQVTEIDDYGSISKGILENGKKEGQWVKLDKNGDTLSLINYNNGKFHGDSFFWQDKLLMEKETFINGSSEGENIFYFPDRKIEIIGNKIKGQKEGLWRNYHKNGRLDYEIMLINNKREGKFIQTWPNGKYFVKGQYKEGKLSGLITVYDSIETITHRINFLEGVPIDTLDLNAP